MIRTYLFWGTGTTTQNQPEEEPGEAFRAAEQAIFWRVCLMASLPEKGWFKRLKNWIPQISNEQNQGGETETSFFF